MGGRRVISRLLLNPRSVFRLSLLGIIFLLFAGISSAFAAANSVPETGADDDTFAVTPNSLKPARCSALNLTNLVAGSGTFNGTGANDLILGSAAADTVNAQGGTDCVLGGGGGDTLRGGGGADIIIAAAGNDNVRGNRGDDVIYGGSGNDSLQGNRQNDTIYGESGDDQLIGGRQTDFCDGGTGTDTAATCETTVNIP